MKLFGKIFFTVALLLLLVAAQAQSIRRQLDSLAQIYNFTYEQLDKGNVFTERYLLWVEQELDWQHPNGKHFRQRVFLAHQNTARPVVLVTEGYWANYAERPNYRNELTTILDANQIVVEHRYFAPSVPADSIFDWQYLTIENAAADHHHVVEILKAIYKENWLNTGISKGGQTAMYHYFYYPEDVKVSVPVVAPLNFSKEEKRVYHHLETVGTPECRAAILAYQTEMLKNKKKYMKEFAKLAKKKGQTYERVGGLEQGYELTVLEFSFAFWQWGASCAMIPNPEVGAEDMVSYLDAIAGLDWISDQGISQQQPFFYQAMRQFGMYGYDITPFKQWVSFDRNPTFEFTFPPGVTVPYSPETHHKVDCYVRHKANNMIFIVGGNDPWGAPSVDLPLETNSFKVVKKGGSHTTRIMNLPEADRKRVISTIREWMR
jgi:hypothetical protein